MEEQNAITLPGYQEGESCCAIRNAAIPWQKVSAHRSRGIGRDEAADLDITAKTDIPNDSFAGFRRSE